MREETWVKGMLELAVSFPDRDETEEVKEARGRVYRRSLGHLSDEQWLYAVDQAIRSESWFPTVRVLLELAEGMPPPEPKGYLPPSSMTPEELERARAEARAISRRGIELCKEAFRNVTGMEPSDPVREMP